MRWPTRSSRPARSRASWCWTAALAYVPIDFADGDAYLDRLPRTRAAT